MKDRMKFNPIRNMNYRTRQVVRNVAICFAALFGLLALYYCLIPALADTAGDSQLYVFFDNGLSQYKENDNDKDNDSSVRINAAVYSDENGQFKSGDLEMKLLADVIKNDSTLWNSVKKQLGNVTEENGTVTIKNVNPNNVYVSTTTVSHGNYVIFNAWSDGIVYDTVVNYRVNSASREWGYDYYDFQWTSEPTKLEVGKTCYYAPPQMMINRYAAVAATESGGAKSLVQMIYEHGDKKGDSYSKPEVEGSWVNPQNAEGRTFYDAQLEMEGKFGDVNGVNDLGKGSQSSTSTLEGSVVLGGDGDNGLGTANTTYHATATFFDYFSDWELAGNPLADHDFTYGYTDAEAANKFLYSVEAKKTESTLSYNVTANEETTGEKTAGTTTTLTFDDNLAPSAYGFTDWGNTTGYNIGLLAGITKDSSAYALNFGQKGVFPAAYALEKGPSDATRTYAVSFYAIAGVDSELSLTVELYVKDVNGNETTTTVKTATLNAYTGDWVQVSIEDSALVRPYDAQAVYLIISASNGARIDDFSITPYDDTTTVTTTTSEKQYGTTIFKNEHHGFVSAATGEAWPVETGRGSHTDDDSYILLLSNADAALYPFTAEGGLIYEATMWVKNNSSGSHRFNVQLVYTLDGTEQAVNLYSDTLTNTWTKIAPAFTVPSGATNVSLKFTGKSYFHFDDFTLTSTKITGSRGDQDGDTSDHITFSPSSWSLPAPTMTIALASGYENDAYSYSNKEVYFAEVEVFVEQYGNIIFKAEHYDENGKLVQTDLMTPVAVVPYSWQTIQSPHYDLPLGAVSTKLTMQMENNESAKIYADKFSIYRGFFNIGDGTLDSASFSDGSNRISYSYMGLSFNEAISQYYKAAGASDSTIALYFGSNSWMTGNMRYYHYDGRTDQYLFTPTEIAKALASVGCETSLTRDDYINTQYDPTPNNPNSGDERTIWADGKKDKGDEFKDKGAYLIPLSREYWRTLFGYEYDSYNELYQKYVTLAGGDADLLQSYLKGYAPNNTVMGFSNSRAVEGLVQYDPALDILMLDGTTVEAPYFSEEFIKGDNEAHAAYGEVYDNVDFAFAYNEDSGYYEFDSTRSYYAVRLTQNGSTGQYYMDYYNYDKLVSHKKGAVDDGEKVVTIAPDANMDYMGVKKADVNYKATTGSSQTIYQFYPFNSPATNDRFATENLMFGMKLDIPFNMAKELTYNGVPAENETVDDLELKGTSVSNSMFKFSGDDDVWVYVDGQPVLDIGGTHTAVGGFIDLKNGLGVIGSAYTDYTGIWDAASDANLTTGEWNEDAGAYLNVTAPTFLHTGTTSLIDDEEEDEALERGAFAALASLDALAFNHDTVKALDVGAATAWVGMTEAKYATVDFFDDVYTFAADADGVYFRYRARKLADDQYVIDVNVPVSINGESAKAGTMSYKLTTFELTENAQNTNSTLITDSVENKTTEYQIIDHELTIYYMERGLNSSNFKLAFNFVPNADREVQKSWGDGTASHSDDAILVALYGAEPQSTTGKFNLANTDYSLVRVIGHQALENSDDDDLFSSGFVSKNDKVSVMCRLKDTVEDSAGVVTGINSAAAVSINGMPITEEVYKQLHDSEMALTIYVDGTEVQIDSDGTYAGYEFFNPKNADGLTEDSDGYLADGFQIQYCTNDWGEGKVTEAQKRSAIKVHDAATASDSWIKIEFNQVDVPDVLNDGGVTPESGINGWGFFDNSAWLIEVFGWNVESNTALPMTSRKINMTQSSEVYATDATSGQARYLYASQMQFVIANIQRERNNSSTVGAENASYVQVCNVTATAVVPGDELDFDYYYTNATRKVMVRTGDWSNIFKSDVSSCGVVGNYDGREFTFTSSPVKLLDVDTSSGARAKMIVVGGGASLGQELGLDFRFDNQFEAEDYGYDEPELYGDAGFEWDIDGDGQNDPGVYLLDDSTDWLALWEGLPSAEVINNETYSYKYFVRELAILEWDAANEKYVEKTDKNFRTTYYADRVAAGNELTPTYFTIDGKGVALYSLDTESGKIVVSNEEITNATITKAWSGVASNEQVEVLVDIYVEDPAVSDEITLYDTVAIGPDNNWSVTLENLLVYNNNQNNPQKLKYYAAEQELEKFTATYNGTRVMKKYGGTELAVYQLNTVTTADPATGEQKESYALTVTNQTDGFVLEIDKFDEDGTTPLEGATFVLYEWTGEGTPDEYLAANPSVDTDHDGKWSADEILANVGFGLWVPVSDGEETETEAVTPQSEEDTADAEDTASVDAPRSVRVMNKVVQTATATVAQANGSTTYTTVKKVGSIDVADKTIESDQSLVVSGTTGNEYFNFMRTDGESLSANGPSGTYNNVALSNGLKMQGATRIEFTAAVDGTITIYASANDGAVTAGFYEIALTDENDNQLDSQVVECTEKGVFAEVTLDVSLEQNSTGNFRIRRTSTNGAGECYISYIKFTATTEEEEPTIPTPETITEDQSLNFNQGNNTSPYFVYYQSDTNELQYSGSVTYDVNGTSMTSKGLKMRNATNIDFSLGVAGTLTLYAMPNSQVTSADSKTKSYTINIVDANGNVVKSQTVDCSHLVNDSTSENHYFGKVTKLEFVFTADELGEYTITRTDEQAFINYISFEVPKVVLPLDNATDAELMMELMNNNNLKYTHDDKVGETIDPETWYSSDLAKQIADKIIEYQIKSDTPWAGEGGWTKEIGDGTVYPPGYNNWNQATIDNDITTAQIRYLSKVYQATGNTKYLDSLTNGIKFILGDAYVGEHYYSKDGQNLEYNNSKDTGLRYANGGFAQRFDEGDAYHRQITFNDDAMVNVLRLLTEIGTGKGDFSFLYGTDLADEAIEAVHAGVQCILDTQIIVNCNQTIVKYTDANGNYHGGTPGVASDWEGKYTGWCQQYDPITLQPGWARAYEPPALSGRESVGVIEYLIEYYKSDLSAQEPTLKAQIPRRVNAAVDWISSTDIQLHLEVCEHSTSDTSAKGCVYYGSSACVGERTNCRWAVENASGTTWARYYSLFDGKTPIWSDRFVGDGLKRDSNGNLVLDKDGKTQGEDEAAHDTAFKASYNAMSCERRSGYNYIDVWPKNIAANPDAYRLPIDGTTVKDLIVYPSHAVELTDSNGKEVSYVTRYTYVYNDDDELVKIDAWYDYGDAWSIVSSIKNQNLAYGNSDLIFTNIPSALIGAEYIRPANASSAQNAADALATFRLNKAANLYIPVPSSILSLPSTMTGWENTGVTLKVGDTVMTLWTKSFSANVSSAEPYSLYSLADANVLNYGVFVVVGSSDATEYTTDANGEVSIAGLKADTYYAIIEIAAPLGYMPLGKPTLFSVFTVKEGEMAGTIDTNTDPDVDDQDTGYVEMQWDKDKATVLDADILNDSTRVELPATGVPFIRVMLRMIAAILPVLAVAHFLRKRMEAPVE